METKYFRTLADAWQYIKNAELKDVRPVKKSVWIRYTGHERIWSVSCG